MIGVSECFVVALILNSIQKLVKKIRLWGFILADGMYLSRLKIRRKFSLAGLGTRTLSCLDFTNLIDLCLNARQIRYLLRLEWDR